MKKVFLVAMLIAGTSIMFVACNNGDYNANPDRNKDYLNPLNPSTGVTIPFGRVQAEPTSCGFTAKSPDFLSSAMKNTAIMRFRKR